LELTIKIVIKWTVDFGCVPLCELVAIQLSEEDAYILQELVDPGYLKEGLIHGLALMLVAHG
jgi:hypothetical protein